MAPIRRPSPAIEPVDFPQPPPGATAAADANDATADAALKRARLQRIQSKTQRRRRLNRVGGLFALLLGAAALLWLWPGSAGQTAYPTVALLPLDSRPVNTDLPVQLAAIAGIDVLLPEREILDQFLTASQPEPLYRWLEEEAADRDITIISVNQLLFGGLIHSREAAQYQNANEKLTVFHDYVLSQERVPEKKLVLSYIMPRTLPSQYDEGMWAWEKELQEISQLRHQSTLAPDDPALSSRIAELEELIPREIRQQYETLYIHAYNTGLSLLDWLLQGLVDEVVIGLDDTAEYGLNIQAFQSLKAAAANRQQDQAFFLHGADELLPLVIARHSLAYSGSSTDFTLAYLTPDWQEALLPYEAIPISENFREKATYLYTGKAGEGSTTGGDRSRPKYIYLHTTENLSATQLAQAAQLIGSDRDRPARALVGLADIAKVNGASPQLIDYLGPGELYREVDAYAGWNTAGNSLGTVMAHLLFWEAAQGFHGPALQQATARHEGLQRLRLIDDYFFQSKVRQELIAWTTAQGFPYLTFGSRWMEANAKLQELMEAAIAPWPELLPSGKAGGSTAAFPYQFAFPWPRSFEVWIRAAN